MKLEQLEILKDLTDDIEVLNLIIDNDDVVIDEIISTLKEVKRKNINKKIDYKFFSSYMNDYFKFVMSKTIYAKRMLAYDFKDCTKEKQKSIILKESEIFKRLLYSISIQNAEKMKDLLHCWEINKYDYNLYNLLVNKNIQNLDNDNLKKIFDCYKEYEESYECSKFDLVSFILNLINYRSIDEIIETIKSNHNFNVNTYNVALMENRSFNEVNKLIKYRDKVKPTLLGQAGDTSLNERAEYLKKLINTEKILVNRNNAEQKELMDIFAENPKMDLYDLIMDEMILTKRTHEEHMTLLNIFIEHKNNYVKNLILNDNLLDMSIIEQISIITLFIEDGKKDLYNVIMKNIDSSYEKLIMIIKSYSKSENDINKASSKTKSISSVYELLKKENINEFNSKTRLLKLEKEDK